LEDLLPESGFYWKRTIKAPYFEDQENSKKYQENIFSQKTQEARRRNREEPGVGSYKGGAA
jgi:hypothetical protein